MTAIIILLGVGVTLFLAGVMIPLLNRDFRPRATPGEPLEDGASLDVVIACLSRGGDDRRHRFQLAAAPFGALVRNIQGPRRRER